MEDRKNFVKNRLINIITNDINIINNEDPDYWLCLKHFLEANDSNIDDIVELIINDEIVDDVENICDEYYEDYIQHNLCYDCEDGNFIQYECECEGENLIEYIVRKTYYED